MESPTLDIYLHNNYPMLAIAWDGKPVIYMNYDAPSGGGGTLPIGSLDAEVEELSKGVVEQIRTTYMPEGTRIRFWNGLQERADVRPGEIIAPPMSGMMDRKKYQGILVYIKEKHPDIKFETMSEN
jgi:hypothetical protein